jgi:hypothetical protein
MLGNILDRLGSLFNRHILLSSFYPLLTFSLLNGVAAYALSWRFQRLVDAIAGDTTGSAVAVLAGALLLAALSYALSTTEPLVRRFLEGRGWPGFVDRVWRHVHRLVPFHLQLEQKLRARQQQRLQQLNAVFEAAREERRRLRRSYQLWTDRLLAARRRGKGLTGAYQRPQQLPVLRERQLQGAEVKAPDLEPLVTLLEAQLQQLDADDAVRSDSSKLDSDRLTFERIVVDAITYWEQAYTRAHADLEASFGDASRLQCTAIGNVAETVRSYAASRYGIDLDSAHVTFETTMRTNAELAGRLDATRTELSFLIAGLLLSTCAAAGWLCFAVWRQTSALRVLVDGHWPLALRQALLMVPPGLLALLALSTAPVWFYLIGAKYAELTGLLRGAIDTCRFDMIRALHLPLPADSSTERRLWEAQQRLSSFAERPDLRFEHAPRN